MVQFLEVNEKQPQRGDVRVPLEGSPAGQAFRTRQPVCLRSIRDSGFREQGISHLTALGMQSACFVPLIHRDKSVGTLAVASRSEVAFTQRETEVLVQVADQVAMAVSNAMVFR